MKPNQPRVSVHVDVYVDGQPVRQPAARPKRLLRAAVGGVFRSYAVHFPTPGCNAPLIQSGGAYCIPANGNSLVSNGAYPATVYACVYPGLVSPLGTTQYDEPDPHAVSTGTLNDGTWSFTANPGSQMPPIPGPLVPGAVPDMAPTGPSNNTLMIWYEYEYFYGWEQEYTVDVVQFHGFLPGSNPMMPEALPAHVPAATLIAEFHAALAPLKKVTLKWNGISWVGTASDHGGTVLSLTRADQVFQLSASGPAASFVVAAQARSTRPFQWQGEGRSIGQVAGLFKVTITE